MPLQGICGDVTVETGLCHGVGTDDGSDQVNDGTEATAGRADVLPPVVHKGKLRGIDPSHEVGGNPPSGQPD